MALLKHIGNCIWQKGLLVLIALIVCFAIAPANASSPFKIDSLTSRQFWVAAQVLPGSGQIINKEYWKVPVFYAGMGSMAYLGHQSNQNYLRVKREFDPLFYGPLEENLFKERWTIYKTQRNIFYTGAVAFYMASVADALIVRHQDKHSPTTATVLSTLIPGLGQIYNQKLWKVPAVIAGFGSLYYVYDFNQRGYKRFGEAYSQHPNDEFEGLRTKDELRFFRDGYRRNRDLSIIALLGFYVLNIIDANVDAHFFDWDISDNLALNLEPTIEGSILARHSFTEPAAGFKLSIKF